ncbi:hypothetical protein [Novosphingobium mangrovi (ex Hu et al. 2023)]|uniref:Porin domain-containing protein n=1 Tax=Novosphingobium mangrovi (ex Hu et al. 2023) TaxID=2930094 RepID=A0ABT0A969_9SPHN|nr:hypothetical protein [Novosphingobium mangrovi (ex Hu et al. 2023)]MCJ1959728.1 hypothetical protein [Novosphingobium mangrovi (ex Hu et al. 2023)]
MGFGLGACVPAAAVHAGEPVAKGVVPLALAATSASAPLSGSRLDLRGFSLSAKPLNTQLRNERVELGPAPEADAEKIKLRWQYATGEDGPRFEIGSIGSRKGAMKRQLLHVALDWEF